MEGLLLKHALGGSVKEVLVGAKLGEVTEPTGMRGAAGEVVPKVLTGRISKRVASRRKFGGGD